jgi:DNA-binding XRE family transcriptional regulator
MKRTTRKRRLIAKQAARSRSIREQIKAELPELTVRHHARMELLEQWQDLLEQLKAARMAKGLSLSDMTELTGMDRSALSKLETGQRPNPTIESLVRYAEAVGKHLTVQVTDAKG